MNPRTPRQLIDSAWTRVQITQYRLDSIVDWIETHIGENNWSVWYGDYYFEREADAVLFKLKWA